MHGSNDVPDAWRERQVEFRRLNGTPRSSWRSGFPALIEVQRAYPPFHDATVVGAAQHDHLICTECGRVSTFRHSGLDRVLADVAEDNGFAAITRQVKIFGVCSETAACRDMQGTDRQAESTSRQRAK